MTQTDDIRVSVCMVTYNQKDYIAQAIESVLMQKTNFKFQLIIGDDASTDGTTEIVRQYAKQDPDIIKPIFHEKNIGSFNNSLSIYSAAKTEFVAILDGDDYWTDENKLQKQVNFLDENKAFNVCCAITKIIFPNKFSKDTIYPSKKEIKEQKVWTFEDLALTSFPFHTSTVLYRWRFKNEDISLYLKKPVCPGDRLLILLHTENGYLGYIDEQMSIYRHGIGMSAEVGFDKKKVMLRYGFLMCDYYEEIKRIFKFRLDYLIAQEKAKTAQDVFEAFVETNDTISLEKLKSNFPEYYWMGLNSSAKKIKREKDIIEIKISKVLKKIKINELLLFSLLFIQLLLFIGLKYGYL